MATIDDLVSLVPLPTAPVDGDGDWRAVETRLGLRLPADFKILMRRYGFGEFADITLFGPFGGRADGTFNLVERALGLVKRLKNIRELAPEAFPFPLYPEPGGLLEWGLTSDGPSLCWLTEGEADSWPVAVWDAAVAGGERYEMGVVELLYGYLSGQHEVPLLRPPPPVPWFEPYRERSVVFVQLSKSELPYLEQLRRLREVLAPTADRGSVKERDRRQDYFKAVERDWLLMYEDNYGYRIRVAFPPEDENEARAVIFHAARAMGCEVLAATSNAEPVWLDGDATTQLPVPQSCQSDEFRLVGQLHPQARLNMLVRLLEWTIDALPSKQRSLLAGQRGETVTAAMEMVRSAAAGSPPNTDSEEVVELGDRLADLADDLHVVDLWQLFNALSDVIGVPAEEFNVDFTHNIMSACYDVIRDCEDLPEFPVGAPESIVLTQERANENCTRAIEFQKELVREAMRQQE